MNKLDITKSSDMIAGRWSRYGVVDVMDGLGLVLERSGVKIENVESDIDVDEVVRMILGRGSRRLVRIPVDAPHDVQRQWLLKVARVINNET